MPGRLAIDFGTCNTVVAAWDEARQEGLALTVPDLSRMFDQGSAQIPVVPSLIHYADEGRRWVGAQVLDENLYDANGTFRWMKSYIARRSPIKKRLGGREISHFEAGTDFLSSVLLYAAQELQVADEEIALTVPVETFEDYENWLTGVAESAGMPRFRVIDEPSAAALGYSANILAGDVYLIFDFGGGTLDVAVVIVEEEGESLGGRRCRVLGKAGFELGGTTIDQWLFQAVLERTGRRDSDENVRALSSALLVSCERAKERLSSYDRADVSVVDPATGAAIAAAFSRPEFEEILEQHDAFTNIDRTIRRALNNARERGYKEEDIKAVLMVGGCSQIPSVQTALRRIFGKQRVMMDRPLDAVARGAAAFVAGVDFYDHIQHDYALRHFDRQKGEHDFLPLVKAGTPYPAEDLTKPLTIKASYDGQKELGLIIFEVSDHRRRSGGGFEIQFDPSGAARLAKVSAETAQDRMRFQIGSPTFLAVDAPAEQGQACFQATFGIDGNKRLLINVKDLSTGQWVHRDYPMVKLT